VNKNLTETNTSEILKRLFPDDVSGVILPIDDYQTHLHPDEYRIISSASDKRKFEFSTGRWCSKQALASQGMYDTMILTGENREPIWPEGFIGSISHCRDQCGAIAAKNSNIKSLGFDIENIKTLRNDIGRIVCTNEEKNWISNQKQYPYNVLVILIFSLKESVYKCVYQHQQTKLGFKDIRITPNLETNTAEIIIDKPQVDLDIKLRFVITRNHIHSAATYL